MILAVSFGVKASSREILSRIFLNIFAIENPRIVDLQNHILESAANDTLLIFGGRAKKLSANKPGRKEFFPELIKLEPEPANEEMRYEVSERLISLANELKNETTLSAESMPSLSCSEIAALEASLRAKGETFWRGTTQDNRSVLLSLLPCSEPSADVSLTFAELFALRAAMEVLQVRELIIGGNSKNGIDSLNK